MDVGHGNPSHFDSLWSGNRSFSGRLPPTTVTQRHALEGKTFQIQLASKFSLNTAKLGPFEGIAYGMTSSDAILSPSSLKKYRRSMGLPGKFPTKWLVT